jgi:hypothetical protein
MVPMCCMVLVLQGMGHGGGEGVLDLIAASGMLQIHPHTRVASKRWMHSHHDGQPCGAPVASGLTSCPLATRDRSRLHACSRVLGAVAGCRELWPPAPSLNGGILCRAPAR